MLGQRRPAARAALCAGDRQRRVQGCKTRDAGKRCGPDRRRAAGGRISPSPAQGISIKPRCGNRFASSLARCPPPDRTRWRWSISPAIGVQFDGENYFVPVDADIQRASDIPLQAIRVSDFTQPLAGLPGRVKIVILDAARQNPFAAAINRWRADWRWSIQCPAWRSHSTPRRERSRRTSRVPTARMRRRSRK